MDNKKDLLLQLQGLLTDNIVKQKRGLHFIISSVFIWTAITVIHLSPLPITTKNLLTFCCSVPLVLFAYLLSKILKIDFQNKDNPFSGLGFLITINQMLYILIVMWVYAVVPENMLMIYALIFGAHLLPYGWLYQSKSYYIFSVFIPISVLYLGIYYSSVIVAIFMLISEIIFSICLMIENRICF